MWDSQDRIRPLFSQGSGLQAMEANIALAGKLADGLREAELLSKSDDEVLTQAKSAYLAKVPTLLDSTDDITFSKKSTKISRQDVFGDRFEQDVTFFEFEVPFTGDAEIFKLQPNTFGSAPPYATVNKNALHISIQDEGDPHRIQQILKGTLDSIKIYLGWHREMFAGMEARIESEVRQRLSQRRQKLAAEQSTEAGLAGFGFKQKF